jgi:hypothetical protein
VQEKAVPVVFAAAEAEEITKEEETAEVVVPVVELKPTPEIQVKTAPPKVETPKAAPSQQVTPKQQSTTKSKTETEPASGRKTLADQFSDSSVSVNERVGQSGQAIDRASMLSRKPVADIHKAIKLNDRIGFIRELFGGDSQKYTQTIDALNNFTDFDQAIDFINQNFGWDQNTESFKTLIEIVYRRYMN